MISAAGVAGARVDHGWLGATNGSPQPSEVCRSELSLQSSRSRASLGAALRSDPSHPVPVEKTRQADAVPLLGMFTERGPIYFVVASEFFDLNRVRA